jgi:hypothetical protein
MGQLCSSIILAVSLVASFVDSSNRSKSDKVYDKARDKVTVSPTQLAVINHKHTTMKHHTTKGLRGLLAATTLGLAVTLAAELPTIPTLPTPARPDGKEADMSKPVQVYIFLGQSNMVGSLLKK